MYIFIYSYSYSLFFCFKLFCVYPASRANRGNLFFCLAPCIVGFTVAGETTWYGGGYVIVADNMLIPWRVVIHNLNGGRRNARKGVGRTHRIWMYMRLKGRANPWRKPAGFWSTCTAKEVGEGKGEEMLRLQRSGSIWLSLTLVRLCEMT